MDIYLIRHGESVMNTGENQSIKEIDSKVWLTETGKKQAEKSAKFLRHPTGILGYLMAEMKVITYKNILHLEIFRS